MDRLEIEKKVKNVLSDYSGLKDTSKISLDSDLEKDLGFDSLDSIEIIMKLEDEFKITIKEERFNTVKEIVDRIENIMEGRKPTITKVTAQRNHDFVAKLRVDKTDLEKAGFNPYYKSVESGLGRIVNIEGKKLINFGSNDYLGIANSQELKKVAHEALEKYGLSMCGTPIVIGQTDITKALEKRLSEFLGMDDTLVFPSGYQANIGIFQILATEQDTIIADKFLHSSLLTGISLSKAKKRFFNHNDCVSLENILKKSGDSRMRFIVVEGLYSTEGDISPLKEIYDLSNKYNAFIVLDDAHGIGVLGKEGRGTTEHLNLLGKIDLITGSLGKALGCFGGFISTSSDLAECFRYRLSPLIYSTALPPLMAAASLASIDIVQNAYEKREKIKQNKEIMYSALKDMGYNLTPSSTPLFSVIAGDNYETAKLARKLEEEGIYGTPFLVPSVPEGRALIRFIPHAGLTHEDLSKAIDAFKNIKQK